MADHFKELFRLSPNLYLEGSPVLIETGALFKDSNTDKIFVLIKYRNLSEKKIISCKTSINAYEQNKSELEGISIYSYLDICVPRGKDFGSKTPIYMPDNTTRKFSLCITEVVFDDDSVWNAPSSEWIPIPPQTTISQKFSDREMVKQYELEAGSDAAYFPSITNGLFLCTCGTINLESSDFCYKCRRKYSTLLEILNEDNLCKNKDLRLQREQEEKIRMEQAALQREEDLKKKKETRKRIIRKAVLILTPIVIIISLIPGVIKPAIINAINYHKASELLNEKSYDLAKSTFESLGDYRNSEDMALESMYQKAESYYSEGEYEDAIEIWQSLGDYSNSQSRVETAEADLKEDQYQTALSYISSGDYKDAIKILKTLEEYKDADNIYLSTSYDYALKLIEEKSYKKAIDIFEDIPGYKDVDDLKIETIYNYACQSLNLGNYEIAIEQFEKCLDYSDSATKILDAKMCFVNSTRNRLSASYNTTSYNYLKDLISANYPGAQDLYNELYTWAAEVTINDGKSSAKWNERVDVGIQVSGGTPKESITINILAIYPNGDTESDSKYITNFDDFSYYWDRGVMSGPYSGTFTIKVTAENGQTLGSSSIRITK